MKKAQNSGEKNPQLKKEINLCCLGNRCNIIEYQLSYYFSNTAKYYLHPLPLVTTQL